MGNCENAGSIDIPLLIQMGEIFANPEQLAIQVGTDILLNGVSIYKDITDAITNFNNSDYFAFGEDIGDAFSLVFFGKPNATAMASNTTNSYMALSGFQSSFLPSDSDY